MQQACAYDYDTYRDGETYGCCPASDSRSAICGGQCIDTSVAQCCFGYTPDMSNVCPFDEGIWCGSLLNTGPRPRHRVENHDGGLASAGFPLSIAAGRLSRSDGPEARLHDCRPC